MTLRERAWGLAVAALRPALPAARALGPKPAAAAAGRRAAADELVRWATGRRPTGRPLLWLHGASAGELLGAAPVVDRLRTARGTDLLVTFASPSARAALPELRPDGSEFVPLDTPSDCRRALGAVEPAALVFARGDLWPSLTRAAAAAGVPMGLVNATVDAGSSRLRTPVRGLLRPGYGRLARAGAATRADARRLRRLGVRREALRVTGDAAVDRALSAAGDGSGDRSGDGPARRLRALAGGRPVVVAGSTWPPDEELLTAAWRRLPGSRGGADGPLLVLVPHEPGPDARARVERACRERWGGTPAVWNGDGPPPAARVDRSLLVNRTGLLSRLYAAAEVAWVGGGLGGDGLHSVVEPAAAGIPVLFGPRGDRREARSLVQRGAARRMPASDPDAVARAVDGLLTDGDSRREMGRAARRYAEENAGAAERGAELVAELLDRGDPQG